MCQCRKRYLTLSVIIRLPVCEIGKSDCLEEEKLDAGHPAFTQPKSFSKLLEIKFSRNGKIRMRLGDLMTNNLKSHVNWEGGEFEYEAVAEPTVIRREKKPLVAGLLHE